MVATQPMCRPRLRTGIRFSVSTRPRNGMTRSVARSALVEDLGAAGRWRRPRQTCRPADVERDAEQVRRLVVDHGDPAVEVDGEHALLDAVQQRLPLLDQTGDLARLEAERLALDPAAPAAASRRRRAGWRCRGRSAGSASRRPGCPARTGRRARPPTTPSVSRVFDVDDRRHRERRAGAVLGARPTTGRGRRRCPAGRRRGSCGSGIGRGDDPPVAQGDHHGRRAGERAPRLHHATGPGRGNPLAARRGAPRAPPRSAASRSAIASARRPSVSRARASDWASETAATPTRTTHTIGELHRQHPAGQRPPTLPRPAGEPPPRAHEPPSDCARRRRSGQQRREHKEQNRVCAPNGDSRSRRSSGTLPGPDPTADKGVSRAMSRTQLKIARRRPAAGLALTACGVSADDNVRPTGAARRSRQGPAHPRPQLARQRLRHHRPRRGQGHAGRQARRAPSRCSTPPAPVAPSACSGSSTRRATTTSSCRWGSASSGPSTRTSRRPRSTTPCRSPS